MVVEMDRRLRRRSNNTVLTRNMMRKKAEGGISFGLLVWLALVQALVRLQ
jgi:hypothetical protein